ncbi:hypothetical protein KCU88_g341, partial [Aureobasidium melanogenum]
LRSTSIFAAGCMTLILFSIVLPSFVIRFSPLPVCIILSIPRGPSEVRMASATARAARILAVRTAMGFSLSCETCRISHVALDSQGSSHGWSVASRKPASAISGTARLRNATASLRCCCCYIQYFL